MKARVQMSIRTILIAVCFMSNSAFGQTTRTGPSASSTTATIPSSSSTSSQHSLQLLQSDEPLLHRENPP